MLENKRKRKTKIEITFSESLTKLKQDWNNLVQCHALSKDAKFLTRMAINIKQIHHDIKLSKHPKKWENQVSKIINLQTVIEAVDNYSVQEPTSSDLSSLISGIASMEKAVH